MNRRTVLGLAAGGGAVGLVGLVVGSRSRAVHVRMVAMTIRRELSDFADLTDAPERYAEAFADAYGGGAWGPDVALNFLLSTDFFHRGEDPTKPVHFQVLYDPLVNPCVVAVPRRME